MTVMEQALKQAGVALPTIPERIWTYIKDHPRSTCFDISSVFKLPFNQVATVAGLLVRRKMLCVEKDRRRARGVSYARLINLYTVPPNMPFYTVLPLGPARHPKKGRVASVKPELKAVPTLPAVEIPAPTPAPQVDKFDLDALTVGEAKLLYERLHRMFGK